MDANSGESRSAVSWRGFQKVRYTPPRQKTPCRQAQRPNVTPCFNVTLLLPPVTRYRTLPPGAGDAVATADKQPTFFAAAACWAGCIDGWRGCLSCCKPPTRRLKHRESSAFSFRRNSCLHPPSRHLHLTNMTIFDKFHVAVFTKPAHVSISGRMISHFELYFDLVLVLSPFARRNNRITLPRCRSRGPRSSAQSTSMSQVPPNISSRALCRSAAFCISEVS